MQEEGTVACFKIPAVVIASV